jgi:OmpA-OmpF porin, OOP family
MMNLPLVSLLVPCLGAGMLLGTGCATKTHVRNVVTPLEQRIDGLEGQTKQQQSSIAELERGLSSADERIKGVDERAGKAQQQADRATELAQSSGELAEAANKNAAEAKSFAEEGLTKLAKRVDTLDDYQLVATENVLFDFNRHQLSDEARQQLDQIAGRIAGGERVMIEVQGYTDKTGDAQYNLDLSQKRADAVVRYLTMEHKIPLYRVSLLGLGAESPVADNSTREGRSQNRRVEVRVFSSSEEMKSQAKLSSTL